MDERIKVSLFEYTHCILHYIKFLKAIAWKFEIEYVFEKLVLFKVDFIFQMVHASWWYYFSKFTEFFDTVRKKNRY